jgi:glycosyltransferase involved in cell wall biosynthesis
VKKFLTKVRLLLSPQAKFRIMRSMEKLLGYGLAYRIKQFVRNEAFFESSEKSILFHGSFLSRPLLPEFEFVGDGELLNFISPWPPTVGGPSEIAPSMRHALTEHYKVKTLVIGATNPGRVTDSVKPFHANETNLALTTLMVVAAGKIFDSPLKHVGDLERPFLLWHDPIMENSKREFIANHGKQGSKVHILVNSNSMKAHLNKGGFPLENIHTISTGAPSRFELDSPRVPGCSRVVFAGTWSQEKFTEEIFESFLTLANEFPKTSFEMLGYTSDVHIEHKTHLIKSRTTYGNFKLQNYVSEKTWRQTLQSASLMVNLRKPPALESSGSLMDAMASGTPTLLSKDGAFGDLDCPGLNAFSGPPTTSNITNQVRGIIERHQSNPDLWLLESESLRLYARARSVRSYCNEIVKIINSI